MLPDEDSPRPCLPYMADAGFHPVSNILRPVNGCDEASSIVSAKGTIQPECWPSQRPAAWAAFMATGRYFCCRQAMAALGPPNQGP